MEPDRLYIDFSVRELLDKIKNLNYLDLNSNTNKEIFEYAMSLGCEMPTSISGRKDALFLAKDLNNESESLMYSAIIPEYDNIDDISNKSMVYDLVQRMANTGFKLIEDSIKNCSIENIEKVLLCDLDEKYKEVLETIGK